MTHGLLVTLHLFCAAVFIGIVAFEVLILESIRSSLPEQSMQQVEAGIHKRARKIMPFFVATLFISGVLMAVGYYSKIGWPLNSSFGTLLAIKIALAISVLVHFMVAIKQSVCGNLSGKQSKYLHLSVFMHMIAIVILAKGMFYISW